MKLQYYIVVNVVIHISKSKGVAEMANKTNKIKKKGGFLRLQVLRFIYKTMNKSPSKVMFGATVLAPTAIRGVSNFWSGHKKGKGKLKILFINRVSKECWERVSHTHQIPLPDPHRRGRGRGNCYGL